MSICLSVCQVGGCSYSPEGATSMLPLLYIHLLYDFAACDLHQTNCNALNADTMLPLCPEHCKIKLFSSSVFRWLARTVVASYRHECSLFISVCRHYRHSFDVLTTSHRSVVDPFPSTSSWLFFALYTIPNICVNVIFYYSKLRRNIELTRHCQLYKCTLEFHSKFSA